MNSVQTALDAMLDGYSHQVAYDRILENRIPPSAAVQAVQEAGKKIPFVRHQIEARAEEHTPSGCCDHCGGELTPPFTAGQSVRWQNRSASGWTDGAADGLAYLCKRCRRKIAPSSLECALHGFKFAAPIVTVGGILDFFFADKNPGLGLVCVLFIAFLVFMWKFSRFSQDGSYTGYPSDTGMGIRRASFRREGVTLAQFAMIIVVMALFSGGCMTAAAEEMGKPVQYSPAIVALVLGLGLFLRHKRKLVETEGRSPSRSWSPRKEQNRLSPDDPEFVTRKCAQLITSGLTSYEARQKLRQLGASAPVIDRAIKLVAPRVAFSRTQRGEVKKGRLCDLCETSFPDKYPEKLTWTYRKVTYIPLYIITITQEETETKTGCHLLCDTCRWGINGPGSSLWATAGALGIFVGLLSSQVLGAFLYPEQTLWGTLILTGILWFGGLAFGLRQRYSGYPANQRFLPEGRITDVKGVLGWMFTVLMGVMAILLISGLDVPPVVKALIALVLCAGAGFLFRFTARFP